jgi:hypothetical protein
MKRLTSTEQLGVRRHELMEALASGRWTDPILACISCCFSRVTYVDNDPVSPWEFWGLDPTVRDLRDACDGGTISGDWDQVLKTRVSILLQQSGLSYEKLLDLLDTRYINPHRVAPTLDGVDCDMSKMKAAWLDEAALNRIHRFVRLWRRLGWSIFDLDRAITAFGANDINPDLILWLSHLKRLQARLNVRWWFF